MQARKPVAGAKSLMERMEAMFRATLPRQARVTRSRGGTVWVRFIGEVAGDPESQFPSTYRDAPPGTTGWVSTLGGKKGLFVATAPPRTIAAPPVFVNPSPVISIGTAGFYPLATTVVSGMVPGVTYVLHISGGARATITSTRAQFSPRATLNGSTQPNQYIDMPLSSVFTVPFNYGIPIVAPANGEIEVAIGVTWNGGTSNFTNISLSTIAVPV